MANLSTVILPVLEEGEITLRAFNLVGAGSSVSINPVLTSGIKIATITINGVDYDLYCQNTWQQNTATDDGYVTAGTGYPNKVWKTNENGVPGWRNDANTTYSDATPSTHGLMSVSDKKKLDTLSSVPTGQYHLTFGETSEN